MSIVAKSIEALKQVDEGKLSVGHAALICYKEIYGTLKDKKSTPDQRLKAIHDSGYPTSWVYQSNGYMLTIATSKEPVEVCIDFNRTAHI